MGTGRMAWEKGKVEQQARARARRGMAGACAGCACQPVCKHSTRRGEGAECAYVRALAVPPLQLGQEPEGVRELAVAHRSGCAQQQAGA